MILGKTWNARSPDHFNSGSNTSTPPAFPEDLYLFRMSATPQCHFLRELTVKLNLQSILYAASSLPYASSQPRLLRDSPTLRQLTCYEGSAHFGPFICQPDLH